MKTRIFHTSFWLDDYIISLTPKEKLMYNFLITNPEVGHTGYFKVAPQVIALATGLTLKEIETIKQKLESDKKVIFCENWVFLVNHDKYQAYTGEKNEIARNKELNLIPVEVIRYCMDRLSSTENSLINHKSEIINHKSEIGVVKGIEIDEVTLQEIADHYKVPIAFVHSKLEDMILWKEQQPNNSKLRGRNWEMTLRNWVKRDAIQILEKQKGDPNRRVVDATHL